ncbi:hypothetical protein RX512_004026 [Providencia rettgeri]|uniref:hypothetical protein n=1 Tax=unclassified Providencia TaxID=2633465 RepID=UPI00234B1787|nr:MULTISPECIES: hypothetical protein [unclassified Providencia]ELL9151768.1 hypothetical protein [Providencia rettgeri]HBK4774744.1 hypothetical protein [Providencia rettgeri]HEF8779593.1 hypothetical protein [Providencia rettgeri]
MKLTPELLRDGCQWLARELTRLEQLNRPLSMDDFFTWSSNEVFIRNMFTQYGEFIKGLHILDHEGEFYCTELAEYMETALSRHANAITPDAYGVVDSAYLLAINFMFSIAREADSL